MDEQTFRNAIEEHALTVIEKDAQAGRITEERAREIARFVIQTIQPGMDTEQLNNALWRLEMEVPELASLRISLAKEAYGK